MSYQNTFKRYELKYLLKRSDKRELLKLLNSHMQPDSYGKNTISNVYFDTPDKRLIRRSLEGPVYKEKLRVRSYGAASRSSTVFIELKKKYRGVVYKRRIALPECQAENYLVYGYPAPDTTQVSREIDYFLRLYRDIEPSVFISYEREAFFGNEDDSFRMTFDENILIREYDLSLTKGVYGESLLPSDTVLLEVKTSLGIPSWLLNFMSERQIYKGSFSKYGYAYSNIMLPKYLGGVKHVA